MEERNANEVEPKKKNNTKKPIDHGGRILVISFFSLGFLFIIFFYLNKDGRICLERRGGEVEKEI